MGPGVRGRAQNLYRFGAGSPSMGRWTTSIAHASLHPPSPTPRNIRRPTAI